jgi:hypothetical protein
MDRIYIIGNGFDCAHKFPTRYRDFMEWYIRDSFHIALVEGIYSDDNFKITRNIGMNKEFLDSMHLDNLLKLRVNLELNQPYDPYFPSGEPRYFTWFVKSEFAKILLDECFNKGWVDIEMEYYDAIKRNLDLIKPKRNYLNDNINQLNNSFSEIKSKLIKYLGTINTAKVNNGIINLFDANIVPYKSLSESRTFLIINFNYTDTIDKYINKEWPNDGVGIRFEVINIHGNIHSSNEPIIFGYGDETDNYFLQIEELNDPVYTKFFKTEGYYLTPYYKRIAEFIESNEYEVYVMGHSCGSSDRVLFKAIFDREGCKEIKIFHHERADGTNDYGEIHRNIGRCFSVENRHAFRKKTIHYDKRNRLPQD